MRLSSFFLLCAIKTEYKCFLCWSIGYHSCAGIYQSFQMDFQKYTKDLEAADDLMVEEISEVDDMSCSHLHTTFNKLLCFAWSSTSLAESQYFSSFSKVLPSFEEHTKGYLGTMEAVNKSYSSVAASWDDWGTLYAIFLLHVSIRCSVYGYKFCDINVVW